MIQFQPAGLPQDTAPQQAPAPSLEEIQYRRKLAEEMMKEGTSYAPVKHWTQGLARVAQALSGNWQMNQANTQSGALQGDANKTLLDIYKPSVTGQGMPAVPKPQAPPQQAPQQPMSSAAEPPMTDDQQGVAKFAQPAMAQAMPGRLATALDPSLAQNGTTGAGSGAASGSGTVDRSQFKNDLQNPEIRNRLIALTHAEVGNQGPEAKQAFLESVVNRAAARNQPLSSAINDPSYFPRITQQRAARGVPGDLAGGYQPLVDAMAGGSNTANYATGNASGTVGFNGGPQTAAYGGERFGIEGPDRAWAQQQGQGQPPSASPARTVWQAPQQPTPAAAQPTQVADASQGQGLTRDTLQRMLQNPLTHEAAQKYIIEHADQKKPDSQFGIVSEGFEGKKYGWHNDKEQTVNEYNSPRAAQGAGQELTGVQAIVQAIKEGKQSPELTNLYRKGGAVREELAKQGVDHAKLLLEYGAAKKQVASLNAPQMVKYVGFANSVVNTIDEVKDLAKQMGNSGMVQYNHAKLATIVNTMGNTEQGKMASRYITAVNTLKEEFANLANGGFAPTESAWKLADQQINGNYGVDQLNASLDEVQRLVRYRIDGIPNFNTLGPGAQNRYVPGAGNRPQMPAGAAQQGTPQAPQIHDLGDGFTMEVH